MQQILDLIPQNHVVSWGGSETLKEMGVQTAVREKGFKVIDRDLAKLQKKELKLCVKHFYAILFDE